MREAPDCWNQSGAGKDRIEMSIDMIPQGDEEVYPAPTAQDWANYSKPFAVFMESPRVSFTFHDPCRDEHGKLICDHAQCR